MFVTKLDAEITELEERVQALTSQIVMREQLQKTAAAGSRLWRQYQLEIENLCAYRVTRSKVLYTLKEQQILQDCTFRADQSCTWCIKATGKITRELYKNSGRCGKCYLSFNPLHYVDRIIEAT